MKKEMLFDRTYFRYVLLEKNVSIGQLSKLLGVHYNTVNYKIKNGSFKIDEIFKILKHLDEDFEDIFKIKKF